MSFTYSGTEPQPSLAWSFESTTTDYVQGLTGTTTGSVSYSAGRYNQGLNITNSPVGTPNTGTNYVTYTNPLTLSAAVGTSMSVWVNSSQLADPFEKSIVCIIEGSTWQLWFEIYTAGIQAVLYDSVLTNIFNVFYNSAPSVSTWYHYALVCNSSTFSFYVNGDLVGTVAITIGTPVFSGGTIEIGGSSGSYAPFSGLVDDFRIYNSALTASQVQSVYSSQGAPAPSLAMPLLNVAFTFDGTTTDYVSGLVPTTTTGTPTYPAGKYNKAISFPNLSRGGASNAATNTLNFSTTPIPSSNSYIGLSMALWVNTTQLPYTNDQSYILLCGDTAIIHQNNAGVNAINTFTYNPTAANYPGVSYNFTPTLGTWYHYCVVCNNGTLTQYINGAQTGIISVPNARTLTTPALSIGSDGTNRPFYGITDDLRIFDRPLTSLQVKAIYNQQGVPGQGDITGPQPNIFLGALLSYPTATGTTPTNDGTKLSFARASSQFLDFGSQTFDMTKGFSVTCKFAFTGTAFNNEVILNFNSISLTRSGTTGSIIFTYYNGTTAYSVTSTNTVAQNQVNTVTVFYTHSSVSISIILNGVTTTSTPAAAATTPRTITNCYVGFQTTTGQNLFAAIANGSSNVASSTDGITWIDSTYTGGLPSSTSWNSITVNINTGVFVAVANSGVAASSTDGITWFSRTIASSPWQSVTVNPTTGVFVAVADTTTNAASSTDGITWTPSSLIFASTWRTVTVNPTTGIFVALSASVLAVSSTNGITWTAYTMPSGPPAGWISVTVNPTTGIFVAVAGDNTNYAASSTNGTSWTIRTLPSTSFWRSVTVNPTTGIFVAIATNPSFFQAASSTDGINWTTRNLPFSSNWRSVTVNPTTGIFVAVANGVFGAAYSTDGINWTTVILPRTLNWQSVTASKSFSNGNYLNGDIYSLNIYNRELTPAELSGPPAPSPWGIFTGTPT